MGRSVPIGHHARGLDLMAKPIDRILIALLAASFGCEQVGASTTKKAGGDKPDRPPAPVAVAPVERGPIASFYVATATLEPEKIATVSARVTGLVESIAAEEGDKVKAGAILLRIDNDEYRLRVAQASARTTQLEDQHKRLEGLVARDLAPVEEFVTVQQDLASAKAEEDLARLELARTTVRAPFTGRIVQRQVDVGQTISNGTPLFDVADLDPLLARVHVPSKELKRLQQGQPVELVVDSSGTRLTGKIFLVSPVIDPSTGTVKVSIEISEYPETIRAGDFAEVRIVTERRDDALLVPRTAVVEERQERVVYVAAEGKAQRRVVEIGFETDDRAQITQGVAVDEKVVVKGQHSLEDGASIKVLEG